MKRIKMISNSKVLAIVVSVDLSRMLCKFREEFGFGGPARNERKVRLVSTITPETGECPICNTPTDKERTYCQGCGKKFPESEDLLVEWE